MAGILIAFAFPAAYGIALGALMLLVWRQKKSVESSLAMMRRWEEEDQRRALPYGRAQA